jgi:hypothetical protein
LTTYLAQEVSEVETTKMDPRFLVQELGRQGVSFAQRERTDREALKDKRS